jgi:hypothetical protein
VPDRQTLMVRRAIAGGVGLVLLILIVLGISGCLHSQKISSLKSYNRNVSAIAQEADQQVARPFFTALTGAQSKSGGALDVSVQINQLRLLAESEASRAHGMGVPGDMAPAQRNLLLTLDFRAGALAKVADQIRTALGGQGASDAVAQIAGQMEVLLASDVIYSQRVLPLVQQVLKANGIHETTTPSRFVLDLGWLDATTVANRLGGAAASNGPVAPGTHGHGVSGVAVGSNTLAAAPAVNRVTGGANPTFTVRVANQGSNSETTVKVDVTVAAGTTKRTASHTIDKTQPGTVSNVDIPVSGVPLNSPARVDVSIEGVPGEKNLTNNRTSYTVVFSA